MVKYYFIFYYFFKPFLRQLFLILGSEIENTQVEGEASTTATTSSKDQTELIKPEDQSKPTEESFGNRCIKAIVGACSLLWVTKHPSALALLVVLFIYSVLKRTGKRLFLYCIYL